MTQQKSIDLINNLLELNNDRIEGYDNAAKETEETELKDLFHQLMKTSYTNKEQLVAHIYQLDGTPVHGTRITGKFFRVWMDVKAFLTGKDRVSILDSCEYGEKVIRDAYNDTLKNNSEDLSIPQKVLLNLQLKGLLVDQAKLTAFRNIIVMEEKNM